MGVVQPKPLHIYAYIRLRGIKLVGVVQTKPLPKFSPNFQGMFTLRGYRADKVLVGIRLPLLPWQHL